METSPTRMTGKRSRSSQQPGGQDVTVTESKRRRSEEEEGEGHAAAAAAAAAPIYTGGAGGAAAVPPPSAAAMQQQSIASTMPVPAGFQNQGVPVDAVITTSTDSFTSSRPPCDPPVGLRQRPPRQESEAVEWSPPPSSSAASSSPRVRTTQSSTTYSEDSRRRSGLQSTRPPSQPPAASASSAQQQSLALVPSSSTALVPVAPAVPIPTHAELMADFQCPICFDLLCRPCTLECGMVVCEACLARTLKHSFTQSHGNRACPVLGRGCKFGPVHRMPSVMAVLHNHLRTVLPQEYARRLKEDEESRDIVRQVRSAAENSSGTISRTQLVALQHQQRRHPFHHHQHGPPPAGHRHHREHPAVDFEAVLRQLRDDMEVLAADPIRFPDVLVEHPWTKTFLQYIVPAILTGVALWAFPGHTPEGFDPIKLRSMSTTAFAQSYVVKALGWWDVGLLMTCHRQPGFIYEVPPVIHSRLSRLKSMALSRVMWPYERLLLASWSDPYHRLMSTFYIVTWSLSTIYLTTYCIFQRVKRRRQAGVPLFRIFLWEVGLLSYLCLVCELWNVFWWWICRFKFQVFECAIDYRLTPANIIESSIISLVLELIFIVSLFMGAPVDPNDYGLLTATWLEQPEEWEKDLQATVMTRFAFVYVPRQLLQLF